MSGKDKKKISSYDRYRKNRPIDILNIVFLIFMTSIFSLYMHNKYFDITGTRGSIFSHVGVVYIILIIMAYILEITMIRFYEPGTRIFYMDSRVVAMPELWAALFLLANGFAWLMAEDKKTAFDGTSGRYFGLGLVIVLVLVFICLSRNACINHWVFISLFLTSTFVYILAFLQHFGYDPFSLRERVVARQKEMFISTFGNINTYGSYLCVVIPIFVALFVLSPKIWVRILSGISLVLSAIAIIPAKSDNVYLGVGVAFLLIFYIAIVNKRFTEYLFAVLLMGIGLMIMAILNSIYQGSQKHINGIAEIVESPKVMLLLNLLIVILLVASLLFRGMNYELYKKVQSKRLLIIISILLVIGGIVVIALGVRSGNSLFVFDDEWGTYRGYIWRRSWDLFKINSTPMQRLFGHGNETVAALMKRYYFAEMVEITNKKYDNCHNEFLQYLVTTGLFGVIAYYGMAICSFIYIGRRMKGDAIAAACLASGVAYLAQALVNLNQPITTPYYFVVLAAGIGYVRYRGQGYGRDALKSNQNNDIK